MMIRRKDERWGIFELREIVQAVNAVHLGTSQAFNSETNRSVD